MIPEAELKDLCRKFEKLKTALIDTSSIIYMKKAGHFSLLAATITLVTIPDVVVEARMPDLNIKIQRSEYPASEDEQSTDRRLVSTAKRTNMPLISEDRGILMTCRRLGIEYYNAYVALIFLFYLGRIDLEEMLERKRKLLAIARYNRWVRSYADELTLFVQKIR